MTHKEATRESLKLAGFFFGGFILANVIGEMFSSSELGLALVVVVFLVAEVRYWLLFKSHLCRFCGRSLFKLYWLFNIFPVKKCSKCAHVNE